ncbi:MAG: methionine--tRNA ligase [Deltaproteobacteria bacterium]|nr:methionine--tRNA ligase [Deltaproteobacteria bacterium]
MAEGRFYITTPIYYVNDEPHIGHVFSTTLVDVAARAHRLLGDEVFFLTGTDEHASKVSDAATERGITAIEWADINAGRFRETFDQYSLTYDDFIRTTQERHKAPVTRWMQQLLDAGDLYLGDYEGWYDAGEEEYVPDSRAEEYDYKSPISGRPLARRTESNYFFRLSAYGDFLLELLEQRPGFVQPDARRNEVIGRIRQGLLDVPASRTGSGEWGIPFPGDPDHTVYVWIDALFNYLSAVDTDERRHLWPADVHLIGKDILWFHAVIWPAVLEALSKCPGNDWIALPGRIHAHGFWISEGQKMSKSLGNFIDLQTLDGYVERFGLDALRWFLVTQGPLGANDSDFADARFTEIYNADLANTLGNCISRVTNMTGRYLDGRAAAPGPHPAEGELEQAAAQAVASFRESLAGFALADCAQAGLELVRRVDGVIEQTKPFQLAKQEDKRPEVGAILYDCAEALRIASILLWPVLPGRVEAFWERIGADYAAPLRQRGDLEAWTRWGGLQAQTSLTKGDALFPRYAP